MISGRASDKAAFAVIYTAAALLVLWGGRRMINYSLDAHFYRDYLLQWEVRITALRHQTFQWPVYNENDPMGYMQRLVLGMQAGGLAAPKSNTQWNFIYQMGKLGERDQQILLVCRIDGIKIYGLSPSTFDRLDRYIDGHTGPDDGRFTGKWSTDQLSRIGIWKI